MIKHYIINLTVRRLRPRSENYIAGDIDVVLKKLNEKYKKNGYVINYIYHEPFAGLQQEEE